mgnify:CR=1 FL=1
MSSTKSSQDNALPTPMNALEDHAEFLRRHIGPDESDINHMLNELGVESIGELMKSTLPTY